MGRFEQRRDKLRRLVRKEGADGILITNFLNVSYLTGFSGDDSYLLVHREGAIILSDTRYAEQLAEECPGLEVDIRRSGQKMVDSIVKTTKYAKVTHLAIEAASMTVALRETIETQLKKTDLVPTTGLVMGLREIKDREEIKEIRKAVDVAQRAFAVIRASLRPARTEQEIAHDLENQIRLFGGSGCSFAPIVAVGARASLPHAMPTDHRIGAADFVLIDWGALVGGYMSDLTRVLVTGKISTKLERIYGVVLKAQLAAIQAIKPGVLMKDVDAAARKVIANAGYGKQFGHGLGHGIGLEIHEMPRLAADFDQPLKSGMVVTVEPGIYLPNWGGVRIEDDVLVTKGGHEVLTSVPKDFSSAIVS